MFNYKNLSDYDFEVLCKEIMERKLGKKLYVFSSGPDGGIDITDDCKEKNIVIQVKRYCESSFSSLKNSLKKEVDKVITLNPQQYYICCAQSLTLKNIEEIYIMFSKYMKGRENILDLQMIDDYLRQDKNKDILKSNYKLWLESVNILNEIHNQSIFIDCESLLYGIEEEKNKFVETSCYEQCKEILEEEGAVLLIGSPGVGKTITTKMLALYYAANKYNIRYTTNGDISKLKDALSMNREDKELILLDDCLGQHYFNMKSTQGNELLALIKYISFYPNKKIILNSRVTIYNQALEETRDLKMFIKAKGFKIQVLNMDEIGMVNRGKIFYNHLYFEDIPKEYFDNLKDKFNYKKIINHRNYTPRLIEFVTHGWNYEKIHPKNYTNFILQKFSNPKEIWQDEFIQRLQVEDRILMTTLYSLTDVEIDIDVLQRAYNYRLKKTSGIDTTRNLFEEAMIRLSKSMIRIVDKYNRQMVGVMNPSINDFLKDFLEKNQNEKENIRENMTEYIQIKRNFSDDMIEIIQKCETEQYNYQRRGQRIGVIIGYICNNQLLLEEYRNVVEYFIREDICDFDEEIITRIDALMKLMDSPFNEFYDTLNLCYQYGLTSLFEQMSLKEYGIFIKKINRQNATELLKEYAEGIIIGLKNIINNECQENIYESYDEFDIDEIIEQNFFEEEVNYLDASREIWKLITDRIKRDIRYVIEQFPDYICNKVIDDIDRIHIPEIDSVVNDYSHVRRDIVPVHTENEDDKLLEYIFQREMS